MVSEAFSGCFMCGGGSGTGKYEFYDQDHPADPAASREAREHSHRIDRELRRDQRRMQKQVS